VHASRHRIPDFGFEPYGVNYAAVVKCLTRDRDDLPALHDFPAEHWKHIRTTNPIESTFATVRHRTTRTKGRLSRQTALAMTHRLMLSARKKWRKRDGRYPLHRHRLSPDHLHPTGMRPRSPPRRIRFNLIENDSRACRVHPHSRDPLQLFVVACFSAQNRFPLFRNRL